MRVPWLRRVAIGPTRRTAQRGRPPPCVADLRSRQDYAALTCVILRLEGAGCSGKT